LTPKWILVVQPGAAPRAQIGRSAGQPKWSALRTQPHMHSHVAIGRRCIIRGAVSYKVEPSTQVLYLMEILGAVAASIQLAQLCYESQRRLREIPGDRRLVTLIKRECETLRTAIDDQRNHLTPEGYEASLHLADGINDILASIQRSKRRTLIARLVSSLDYKVPVSSKDSIPCS